MADADPDDAFAVVAPASRPANRRAAVIGYPISHSLSPVLHRAGYAALGLTGWSYDAAECAAAALSELVRTSGPDVAGYSCTMPLKRAVLDVADSVSPLARHIGAGNTLLQGPPGHWRAENTDWIGVREALTERQVGRDAAVVILGAGGTAQAALAALPEASSVTVLVRQPARAADLAQTARRLDRRVKIGSLSDDQPIRAADLVISTLPRAVPARSELAQLPWRSGQTLLDAVYDPWPTELAAAVSARGATVVSGALMLLHQAVAQFELMTGSRAPVEAMRAALRSAAPGCGV